MNEMKLRGITSASMLRLGEQARKMNLSRNKYVCRQLEMIAQSPELFAREDKYEKLLNVLMAELKEYQSAITANTKLMEEVLKKYEEKQ